MTKFTSLTGATAALFCAFFVSCLYETWRDFGVQRMIEPTPILKISDNPYEFFVFRNLLKFCCFGFLTL